MELDLESLPNIKTYAKALRATIYSEYIKKDQFFAIEYTPKRGRANCRGCHKFIKIGELRARHIVCGNHCFTIKTNIKKNDNLKKIQDVCGRWHLNCLLQFQDKHPTWFKYTNSQWNKITYPEMLAGFTKLNEEDQKKIKQLLSEGNYE